MLEEKALLNQKKSQEKREADRQRRVEQMKAYVEPEWSAVDKKLEELDLAENPKPKIKTNNESDDENNDENSNANNNQEEDDDDFDESLFCVACNKSFKNEKSFLNHEKSKKHRENIDLLKKHMKEEDKNALFGEENEKDDSDAEETKKPSEKVKLSKKQKKKRKQNKNFSSSGDENEEAADNTDETKDILKVDDLSEVIDATNSEVDQSLSTQKEEEIVNIEDITFKTNSKTEAPANEPKKAICSVCNKEFESRSKLFLHIKEEGHAAPKLPEQPMSHNSVKRNKRLAKSKK